MREANAELKSTQERLQQAQKMEIIGQLTGSVAHDFNNMAQVISGGLTLLERRIAAQRYVDIDRLIGDMRRTLAAAAGITNRLLAFSRRQVLQPMRINPDQFVGGMRDFLQRTIGPGIRLSVRLEGAEADIVCDSVGGGSPQPCDQRARRHAAGWRARCVGA
jgi:signal transduction histidine kinase